MAPVADPETIAGLSPDLFQKERGVYIAPVRHHSPACAFAVRALIRSVCPRTILIEAPSDFESLIPLLLDAATRPPVAIVALSDRDEGRRAASYFPFCSHSPEYVAMKEAQALGASIRFIDAPSLSKALLKDASEATQRSLTEERHFNSGDFVRALARAYGCRDGFEVWDHLFESRLGEPDHERLLKDIGAYCAALREATSSEAIEADGDAERERHMAAHLLAAMKDGSPVVAVVGGFHAPALVSAAIAGKSAKPEGAVSAERAYLIRYGFAALDALNGYGAGLPQPGYYDRLWQEAGAKQGAPDWRGLGLSLANAFAQEMRTKGFAISVPAQVEMLRVAETLALMRGRPGIMRYDLFDGARAALVKGEAALSEPWTERLAEYLRGAAIGDIPRSAGSPPLVEDVRREARRHRLDVSDSARRKRHLDIQRNPAHRAASQFFYATQLLECGFAELERGPDFVNGVDTQLLFEDWNFAWSPLVEGRLIDASAYADRLKTACIAKLMARRETLIAEGQARDIAALVAMLANGLQAGLGKDLGRFVQLLAQDIETHADFASVAHALKRLYHMKRSAGPLGAPPELDFGRLLRACYLRLVYLCDDLPNSAPEKIPARLEALKLTAELLRADTEEALDHTLFDEALSRVPAARLPSELRGAVLALCVQSGHRTVRELAGSISGSFDGVALGPEERSGALRGLIHVAPRLLMAEEEILQAIDGFLLDLPSADFTALLPHLRLAFAGLNPREVDELAALLAKRHGSVAGRFTPPAARATESDFALGLHLDRAFEQSLAGDGLVAWFEREGP